MLYLVQSAATVVLTSLAVQDLRTRRLPNRSVLAFAALYFVSAALARDGTASIAAHVAMAAVMMLLFGVFRHVGWIGGGDVKLAAAVFLWAGPALALPTLTIVGASGLAVGVAANRAASWHPHVPPARMTAARGVPYGVALALGGAFCVWAPFSHAASLT